MSEINPDLAMDDLLEDLPSRWALCRTVPLLDAALDERFAKMIADKRGVSFEGCGFITDGATPEPGKWCGLTFQITIVIAIFIPPVDEWGEPQYDKRPPHSIGRRLCDLCSVPNKKGVTLAEEILPKQLSRLGLSIADAISGTTDGGGENEGVDGVHSIFERYNASYVRRRGLEHVSWNVCGAGLAAIPELVRKYRALQSYLSERGTWKRLQDIATLPQPDGTDPMMEELSHDFQRAFCPQPPHAADTRNEQTDKEFLVWLGSPGRENILVRCVRIDVEQRGVAGSLEALATMESNLERAQRAIVAELLIRGLYLHRFSNDHEHIALRTTPEALTEKAASLISESAPSQEFLDRIGVTLDSVVDAECLGMSWPMIYLKFVNEDPNIIEDVLDTPGDVGAHDSASDRHCVQHREDAVVAYEHPVDRCEPGPDQRSQATGPPRSPASGGRVKVRGVFQRPGGSDGGARRVR